MKLKPCPFCGSEDVERNGRTIIYVACRTCKTDGPIATTRKKAIELWNTRKTEEQKDEKNL